MGRFTDRVASKKGRSKGNCYEASVKLMQKLTLEARDPGVVLVHGRPRLQRPPHERYGHAWVELEDSVCLNASRGNKMAVGKATFYKAGEIDPADCIYYTPLEASEWMLKTGHFGPWEGPEAVLVKEQNPSPLG